MTSVSIEEQLADAERRVVSGDLRGAAPIFERVGEVYGRQHQDGDAARAWVTAARVRMMLGETKRAEQLLGRAVRPAARAGLEAEVLHARAELADALGGAERRRAAWRAWLDAVDGPAAIGALRRLAVVEREAGTLDAARRWLDEASTRAAETGLDELRRDAELDGVAIDLARNAPDAAAAALLALEPALPTTPHPHRARWHEQRALVSRAQGDGAAALAHAKEARAAAVACTDVQAYLAAAMLLFALHEEAGEAVAAYDTLVRARESLADVLGPEGRALVEPALSAWMARIGRDKAEGVHAAWVEQRRAERATGGR